MRLLPPKLRIRLSDAGLLPTSKLARAAWYVLWQDVFLFLLKQLLSLAGVSWANSLSGAIILFSLVAILLFILLGLREVRARLLWRLRNRLIVTYVFIGVIPVVLLIALALGSFYLFAGQFATFIVTTSLNSELKSVDAANAAIAHELAVRLNPNDKPAPIGIESLRRSNQAWSRRHVHVWHDGKLLLSSSPDGAITAAPVLPPYLKDSFDEIVRDHGELFLRAVETVTTPRGRLTVLSSEPLDAHMLQGLANNLGELTLYTTGLSRVTVNQKPSDTNSAAKPDSQSRSSVTYNQSERLCIRYQQESPTQFCDRQCSSTYPLARRTSLFCNGHLGRGLGHPETPPAPLPLPCKRASPHSTAGCSARSAISPRPLNTACSSWPCFWLSSN
jgi:hypothetical protein